ncbi:hypothetical protein [Nannocystis punicea]|uniref:Uncharacterized protein n=1 Tax=Nannocystis punicea TaxID=2995304 RepID=A0ABY7HEM2_9BACT|nr:hypothetical protein [Nannocystis poenicansa]WAS97578.1 hypothetical protein O0S08_15650 [Nannocystis poenicansa]
MSARPSLFVCAALLAALLAPPASASTAREATRGSAQKAATASAGRQKAAATRPAATAAAPARPTAAAPPGRQDMVKRPGSSPAATHVRSSTAAPANVTTRSRGQTDAVDGRGPGKRADVIDGRDAAALRELYRRKPARDRRRAETSQTATAARPGKSGRPAEAGTREANRPSAATTAAARGTSRPEAAPAEPRREDHGATGAAERKKIDASPSGRQTPAVVTREPISAPPAREPEAEPAPAVVKGPDSSDMVQKAGSKKQRRKAADEDEAVAVASGPRATAASSCASGLGAAPALQFDRTRTSLREFSWADMAYFFETAADEAEPEPRQVAREGALPAEEAIRRSGLSRRPLEALAQAQSVDLLTERELVRIDKALAGASPAAIATLLQADSPTLRAHVWTWLATTPSGACTLVKLDGRDVEAAIHDRSVAVEHGEDLVFRPLGDYALQARSRLAAADPQAYDSLLRTLATEAGLDARVRALVAGLRVRRGHADSIEAGLRDPVAAIRGATAAAAIDRDRPRYEGRMLDHAADDPADLVTELIVGELLGGPDGTPQGELAQRRDERVMAALARWKGRGDPMSPLPVPSQPLRFPAQKKLESAPAPAPAPMIAATPAEPAREPEAPAPAQAKPVAEEPAEAPRPLAHTPVRREPEAPTGPQLPSVLDDPTETSLRP